MFNVHSCHVCLVFVTFTTNREYDQLNPSLLLRIQNYPVMIFFPNLTPEHRWSLCLSLCLIPGHWNWKPVSWPKNGSRAWAELILIHKPQEKSLKRRPLIGYTEAMYSYTLLVHAGPCGWGRGTAVRYLTVLRTRFTRLSSCQRAAVRKSFESKHFRDKKNTSHSSNAPRPTTGMSHHVSSTNPSWRAQNSSRAGGIEVVTKFKQGTFKKWLSKIMRKTGT